MDETIKITGHSDDIIHVESKNERLDDEHKGGDDAGECVVVHSMPAHTDVFRVRYGFGDRAVWNIEHETKSGNLRVAIVRAPEGDDPDPYTDTVTVTGPIVGVEVWPTWPPDEEAICDRWQRMADDLDGDDQVAAYHAVMASRRSRG